MAEAETEKASMSPAAKAAAAKAAKAAAAKKAAPKSKPLVDNGDGTVTDPNSGLIWKKTDAWLDTQKFLPGRPIGSMSMRPIRKSLPDTTIGGFPTRPKR